MKTYKGTRRANQSAVTVDGEPLKMRRPSYDTRNISFTWGEESAGAERLALSILADCLHDHHALFFAHEFMEDVVSKLDPEWELTSDDIEDWRKVKCEIA
jgi:hypothetical protein